MERSKTPPRRTRSSARTNPPPHSPPTPEVTKRIEESRLKAKAIRDQYEASQLAKGQPPSLHKTPSGFIANDNRKRPYNSITRDNIPETQRDARNNGASADAGKAGGAGGSKADEGIQAARKFTKYVEYDFSKMTDTRGGFMTAEDDPHNKAMHSTKDGEKPAHMTLKEWERHQLLKKLRHTKQGPFEPGLSAFGSDGEVRKKCRECGSLEIDWTWEEVFKCAVCGKCKEEFPEKYSLLTKTECRDDYLITDPELKDSDLLPHLSKPNPHKSHWHDMMLFLRYQVESYAFTTKWGSAEALDAEFEKREIQKKQRKEEKFKSKLQELKRKTRTEAFRRENAKGGGKGSARFGDVVGGAGKHEHEWGRTVENGEGVTVKTCVECGMEVEELEF